MLGLQAQGFSYQEISEQTSASLRTVERQLIGARRKLDGARNARGG